MQQTNLTIFLALAIGFFHAFEIDHVVAVTNLINRTKNVIHALKEGALWGLGHTSSIFLFGIIMLLFQAKVNEGIFSYFEGLVGIMLIALGVWRLIESIKNFKISWHHGHHHNPKEVGMMAYSVGLIHGLAGSGALIILVLSQSKNASLGMVYLLLFGVGSILGMIIVSGILSFPNFSIFKKYTYLPVCFSLLSSCIGIAVGINLAIQNIFL